MKSLSPRAALLPLALTALLTLPGCASSGGVGSAPDLPPVVPCETQPWNMEGAPYSEDEFRTAGALPPVPTNGDEVSRMILDASRLLRADAGQSQLRLQAVFQILVGPDGEQLSHQMAVSSGEPILDQTGARMARALRFRPATRFGCGVVAWFEFPVRLAIN